MKTTMLMLSAALHLFPLIAFGDPSLKEETQRQMERVKEAKAKPGVFPEFVEKLNQMFLQYPIAHIAIEGISKDAKQIRRNILIKGEEVYVTANEGWNLVADSSGVYEWETGKQTGVKIRRNNEELLDYVIYLTDPAGVFSSLYSGYRQAAEGYERVENGGKGWTEIRRKAPISGLEGWEVVVFFSEKPFWLYGGRWNSQDGKKTEMIVSKPREATIVPDELIQDFKRIKFEDSGLSLKRHLKFL